ncbi:MAG: glycosyltransferase family 2 protein [Desulfurococcaceae archaeon]
MISIIIVTWNGEKYIEKLIKSLSYAVKKCEDEVEVIFVDNASTDGTLNLINSYIHLLGRNRSKLIKLNKNLHFAAGNNIGITYAKGDIIFLLNQDTYVDENFLQEVSRTFREDPSIGVAQCLLLQYRYPQILDSCGDQISELGPGTIGCIGESAAHVLSRITNLSEIQIARGAALAVRRKILEISKLFFNTYLPKYFIVGGYEDWFISLFARLLGFRVVILKNCIVYHDSLSIRNYNPYVLYNIINLFVEFGAPLRRILYIPLISLIAVIVYRRNIRIFLHVILYVLKRFRYMLHKKYYIEVLSKITNIRIKDLWKSKVSATSWLRWYIGYLRLVHKLRALQQ